MRILPEKEMKLHCVVDENPDLNQRTTGTSSTQSCLLWLPTLVEGHMFSEHMHANPDFLWLWCSICNMNHTHMTHMSTYDGLQTEDTVLCGVNMHNQAIHLFGYNYIIGSVIL